MLQIKNLFDNSHQSPDPDNTWSKIALLLITFFGEQIGLLFFALITSLIGPKHLTIGMTLGAITSLFWLYWIIQIPFNFKSNIQPYTYKRWYQNPWVFAALNVLVILIMSATWGFIALECLGLKSGQMLSQNEQNINSFMHHTISLTFIMIMSIVVAPIVEEFCFRYLIIGADKNNHHLTWLKLILSVVLFALIHLVSQLNSPHTTPIEWLYYFVAYALIGLDLTVIYYKHRNYQLNVICHGTYNLIATVISLM